MFRYALTLVAYAVAIIAIGYVTYSVAPAGANAMTALIISGAIGALSIVCAVLALLIRGNRTLGMVGIHVGLILPLVAVGGTASRLAGSLEGTTQGNAALEALVDQAESAGTGMLQKADEDEGWKLTFPGSDVTVGMDKVLEPKGYQSVGIASTAALSAFAFLALLLHRPKVPAKEQPAPSEA